MCSSLDFQKRGKNKTLKRKMKRASVDMKTIAMEVQENGNGQT